MGNSSSTRRKSATPTNNLLIDASDSYVTEVKLKSTGLIPISEYIKKDKYNKSLQWSRELKNNVPEAKDCKSKDKDEKSNRLFTIKEEKSEKNVKRGRATQASSLETIKEKKKSFIESSFEDIPSKRKWINSNHSDSKPKPSQSKSVIKNTLKNQKTQTKSPVVLVDVVKDGQNDSSEEIRQLYKNFIYPHIYKNSYIRRAEQKEKRNEKPPVPSETQLCISETELKKNLLPKPKRAKYEESTHQLNQHHYNRAKPENKKPNKLSVQTNVACVIHPDRKQFYSPSSEETLRRRFLPKKCSTAVESFSYVATPRPTTAPIQRKVDTIDKVTKEHRKFLSGRQALENWKNIHTLKQHRKHSNTNNTNYSTYHEDNYRYVSRPPLYEERNEKYYPSRPVRSRAGNRDDGYNQKMTPLEISNFNYAKQPTNVKIGYISPKEVKERYQPMKQPSFRNCTPEYYRPESPRYEYIDNTSYGRYCPSPRYPNFEDNYFRNSPRVEFLEREERAMDRDDFISDMERCLQKKIDSVYNGRPMGSNNKTTWVQDKYRRWHKVAMSQL